MRLRYLALIAGLVCLVVVTLGALIFIRAEPAKVEQKPVLARYWTNQRLLAELAPKFGTFPGDGLGLPGFSCDAFGMQRYQRVVVVCRG